MSFENEVVKRSLPGTRCTNTMIRLFALVALAFTAAQPVAASPPPVRNFWTQSAPAHNRGVLHGKVVSVDYGRGLLVVKFSGGTRTIRVLPSTSIETKANGNGSLTDVRSGTSVDVYISDIGGESVAQLVRIH